MVLHVPMGKAMAVPFIRWHIYGAFVATQMLWRVILGMTWRADVKLHVLLQLLDRNIGKANGAQLDLLHIIFHLASCVRHLQRWLDGTH